MRFRMITGFAAAILIISCGALAAPESGTQEYVYAIEIGGVLCGYSEATTTPVERECRELVEEKIYFFVKINALGSTFDSEVRLTYLTDPATGAFTYHDSEVDQADVHLDSAIRIEGDTALVTSSLAPDEKGLSARRHRLGDLSLPSASQVRFRRSERDREDIPDLRRPRAGRP